MGDEPLTMRMEQLSSKVDKIALQITDIVDALGVPEEKKAEIKAIAIAAGGRRRRRSRRGKRPRKSRRSRRH
jgi:hypothetical protein